MWESGKIHGRYTSVRNVVNHKEYKKWDTDREEHYKLLPTEDRDEFRLLETQELTNAKDIEIITDLL